MRRNELLSITRRRSRHGCDGTTPVPLFEDRASLKRVFAAWPSRAPPHDPPCLGAGPLDVGNAWRRRGVSFPRQPRRLVWWVPPIRSERQGSPVEISPWRAHRIWRPRSLIRAHREIGATSGACWVQIRLIVNGGVRGSNPDTLRQT